MTRRLARKVVMDILYEIGKGRDLPSALAPYKECDQGEFIKKFVSCVEEKKDFCDSKIAKFLKNWQLERLNDIDKIIMRMAVAEMFFLNTDIAVALNEAVELAKKYSTEKSPAFVNGVLDKISKELKGGKKDV